MPGYGPELLFQNIYCDICEAMPYIYMFNINVFCVQVTITLSGHTNSLPHILMYSHAFIITCKLEYISKASCVFSVLCILYAIF